MCGVRSTLLLLPGGAARQAGSRSLSAAAYRLSGPGYLRITARKARLVLRPVLLAAPHLSPTSEPAESSMHYARKTAAGVADAARRGRERGATGAGTAPALSTVHLPIPPRLPTWKTPGAGGGWRGKACGEGRCPRFVPGLWNFPQLRGGMVQGALAYVLRQNNFKVIEDRGGDLVFRKEAGMQP